MVTEISKVNQQLKDLSLSSLCTLPFKSLNLKRHLQDNEGRESITAIIFELYQ